VVVSVPSRLHLPPDGTLALVGLRCGGSNAKGHVAQSFEERTRRSLALAKTEGRECTPSVGISVPAHLYRRCSKTLALVGLRSRRPLTARSPLDVPVQGS
jgi:hypothetical protein